MTTEKTQHDYDDFELSPEQIARLRAAAAEGETLTGGFEGRSWRPDLHPERCDLKESARRAKIARIKGGVVTAQVLTGRVAARYAWGRRAYFLDALRADGEHETVMLPEHHAIYEALNKVRLGARVYVEYQGRGEAKAGRTPPHRYRVTCIHRDDVLPEPRSDALKIVSRDEREAEAARAAAAARARAAAPVGHDGDDGDDGDASDEDVPF
jgi:hypothetical protein